jgi:hypothetical protein
MCDGPEVHLEAEVLHSTCCHELAEVAEEVEAWHGLVVKLRVLEGVYGSEDRLVELLPAQRLGHVSGFHGWRR